MCWWSVELHRPPLPRFVPLWGTLAKCDYLHDIVVIYTSLFLFNSFFRHCCIIGQEALREESFLLMVIKGNNFSVSFQASVQLLATCTSILLMVASTPLPHPASMSSPKAEALGNSQSRSKMHPAEPWVTSFYIKHFFQQTWPASPSQGFHHLLLAEFGRYLHPVGQPGGWRGSEDRGHTESPWRGLCGGTIPSHSSIFQWYFITSTCFGMYRKNFFYDWLSEWVNEWKVLPVWNWVG